MSKLHYNIIVSGRVQGVSFRAYTAEEARKIGLMGFVKNLDNGNVYIEAEGTIEQLEALVQWCYKGSPLSKVLKVEKNQGDLKNFTEFRIQR